MSLCLDLANDLNLDLEGPFIHEQNIHSPYKLVLRLLPL